MVEGIDETWYIAIMKMGGRHFPFTGAGSSYYRNFSHFARRSGVEILAEAFDVTDETIDRIQGFEDGKGVYESRLTALTERLNSCQEIDAQKELRELIKAAV